MATLDLSKSGYGVEVLSYYLWGQTTAPNKSEIANGKWLQRNKEITLNVSAKEYMKYVDKYTSAANFGIFQKFFDNKVPHPTGIAGTTMVSVPYTKEQMYSVGATINSDGFYELDIRQMGDIIYGKGKNPFFVNNQYKELSTDISHYTLDVNSNNYAERAFVFGSSDMTFTTKDVKFLINAKTFKPEFIDNLQIKPVEDDFNFEGGGVIAKVANHYLNKLTDPSGIGKTVQINFTDKDKIDHIKVSKDDFNKLKVKFDNSKNLTPNLDAYEKYFNNTIIKSGVIDYLDENNKLVMFGSNNSDSMVNTQATNMNFNEALYSGFVDIYNHYISSYYGKGITYVGGKGSDTIIGTEFDDILYSNDKSLKDDNSPDILKGGDGYDTYYANDKDIITDSDGKGKVYLNNSQSHLKGGRFIEEESNGNIEIYKNNDDSIIYEYNTSTKVLKANELIIKDFDNEELEINLQKDINYEFAILSDTTGSMSGAISSVKSQAKELVNLAFSKNDKFRIGVFGYNDPNVETFTNLTNDKNAIISAINSLHATDGGDTPEMTYKGIINAAKSNWGEYSQKKIFIFGDAPAKDPENRALALSILKPNKKALRSYATLNALYKDDFSNLNNIEIYAIQIGNDVQTKKEFEELANLTGGKYINSSSYESVADAIFDSMNDGTQKSETIIGNNKNNIIEGKGGNDILQGKEGSDTYIFKDKFDKDIIIETNKNNIDKNKIDLSSFSIKDAKFKVDNNDLTITIIDTKKDSFITALDKISHNITKFLDLNFTEFKDINIKDSIKGSITIKEFFNKDEFKISTINFSDHTIDETTLNSLSKNRVDNIEILNNSFINPFKSNLIISNEDIVKATLKDDIVVANKDNQTIISNLGNDTLITNKNNNTLKGENGDDTYIIGKDANNTIIRDKEYVNLVDGGNDTLILNDIDKSSVEFKLGGSFNKDLIINYSNSHSKDIKTLTIQNQTNKYSAIENINLDGAMLGAETINKIIQDLNSYGDDKGLSLNFNSEFKNNDIMQVYNS